MGVIWHGDLNSGVEKELSKHENVKMLPLNIGVYIIEYINRFLYPE
jgi:hypothetical protein